MLAFPLAIVSAGSPLRPCPWHLEHATGADARLPSPGDDRDCGSPRSFCGSSEHGDLALLLRPQTLAASRQFDVGTGVGGEELA